jgi:hypothetical protein
MVEFFKDVTIKLLGIVDSYFPWHSKATDYILPKNLLSPVAAMLTTGFTSIHLAKYSTATTAYL